MKTAIKSIVPVIFLALISFLLLVAVSRGQTAEIAASGGNFTLEKTVVAGGGNQMQQQNINQNGTTGQTIAGSQSSGGSYTIQSGFWTPDNFAPTSATATIAGRVIAPDRRGIRNAVVTITYPNGTIQRALTGNFGYYSFAEIPVGEIYVISVASKRFSFNQPTLVINLISDETDINFVADETNAANSQPQP